MTMPLPRSGQESALSGFPVFTTHERQRIVTADPWAFLLHTTKTSLPRATEARAAAFVEQGRDFFQSAIASNAAGKPLYYYYYAFLNVMKAALLVRRVNIPDVLTHGINHPRIYQRDRLTFSAQAVHIPGRASNQQEFFPEILEALGFGHCANRTWKVMDLLSLIPSIHRTYTMVARTQPEFLPISDLRLVSQGKFLWARMRTLAYGDGVHAAGVLKGRQKFNRVFHEVRSHSSEHILFETAPVEFDASTREAAMSDLGNAIRSIGISTVLTSTGYRYYMSTKTQTNYMPRLAAAYAVFFYLGSITRYRPHDFDKIVNGKYRWIIEELLATEPNQLLYASCSWISKSEVVRPYAVIG